jgi:hypothetical protein
MRRRTLTPQITINIVCLVDDHGLDDNAATGSDRVPVGVFFSSTAQLRLLIRPDACVNAGRVGRWLPNGRLRLYRLELS